LALFLIFMVAIGLNKHIAGWTLIGLLVVALFVGSALTIVVARRRGRERLRYVLPHLNVQSMRERLAQLEPKR